MREKKNFLFWIIENFQWRNSSLVTENAFRKNWVIFCHAVMQRKIFESLYSTKKNKKNLQTCEEKLCFIGY